LAKEKTVKSALDMMIEKEFMEMQDISLGKDVEPSHYFDVGNYALNYICSKKLKAGIPLNKITDMSGLSSTGKSLFMATLVKDPTVDKVIVFSTEGAGLGRSIFEHIGVDQNKSIKYIPVQTWDNYRVSLEDASVECDISEKDMPTKLTTEKYVYHYGFTSMIKKILFNIEYNKTDEKVLILLDSIANLKPARTVFAGTSDMGLAGKMANLMFSAIDNVIEKVPVAFVFSNKLYTNITNPYDPWVESGGVSMAYNPHLSIRLSTISDSEDLTDAELKEEKLRRKSALGMAVRPIKATIRKSRAGTESRCCVCLIDSTYGVIRTSGLFELLKDFDVIKKNGSRYSIAEMEEFSSFFKKDFIGIFLKNEAVFIEKIQQLLEEREKQIKAERLSLQVSDMAELLDKDLIEEQEEDTSAIALEAIADQMEMDE
jgi:RecA/RadA recombinase